MSIASLLPPSTQPRSVSRTVDAASSACTIHAAGLASVSRRIVSWRVRPTGHEPWAIALAISVILLAIMYGLAFWRESHNEAVRQNKIQFEAMLLRTGPLTRP